MSSTISNVNCPECGGDALSEQDTDTLEIHVHCTMPDCDYDSDTDEVDWNDGYDDVECTDCDECDGMCGQ